LPDAQITIIMIMVMIMVMVIVITVMMMVVDMGEDIQKKGKRWRCRWAQVVT